MRLSVVRPPRLERGGRVAVVTPSWPGPVLLPSAYRRALDALCRSGYVPVPARHATARRTRWTSATPQERADDINTAFADPEIDAVLCAIGGDHSAQLLPHLDLDVIARNPKPFCGYSDATALHHAIHTATGLITFYGPALIPQWGVVGGPLPHTTRHFEKVVGSNAPAGPVDRFAERVDDSDFDRSERTGRPLRGRPARPRRVLRGGTGQGPLLAACLPSARVLLGTPWRPEYAGRVLVLDLPSAPYSVADADADLTHLRLAGCLDDLAALAVCRTRGLTDHDEDEVHELVLHHVQGTSYPVVGHVEGGHSDPMPTWPIGVTATVADDEITIRDAAVCSKEVA